MERAKVVLIPLDTYDQERVDAVVAEGFSLLGGLETLFCPEERILLKPNMLSRALPQKAITTHPAVFSAVAKALQAAGCQHLTYGDSPGNPTNTPAKAAETCGIGAAAEALGIPLGDFTHSETVSFPEGQVAKSFAFAKAVTEAEAMINLCKMKTHALERITGGVKNLYGCICGVNKAAGHAVHPSSDTFAQMLCDMHRYLKPRLHVMDAVLAMEGNGPSSGTPVAMNLLLFSTDPVAMDSLFAALVNLSPEAVPTCVYGQEMGVGIMDPERIDVVTPQGVLTVEQAAKAYGKPDFDVFRGVMKKHFLSKVMPLLPFLQHRPKVDRKKCIGCGLCQESCPVAEKAVHAGNGQKAKYDYSKCIRCYCCQEMCPAKAITVYRSPLSKLLGS